MNIPKRSLIFLSLFIGFALHIVMAQPRPQNAVNPPATNSKKEILTNASIIELVQLGFSEGVLSEKIRQSECNFDTSMSGLKQLKAAKVSETIIALMMKPHANASGF
jgi:hypothetical protein